MAGEYEVVRSNNLNHAMLSVWWLVEHKVDHHQMVYCQNCLKLSPYNGSWPSGCPHCGFSFGTQYVPTEHEAPKERVEINPSTGVGSDGEQYEMVQDWDRGWIWQPKSVR